MSINFTDPTFLATLPKSRKEAKAHQVLHYCTSKLCKRGHLSARLTSTGECRVCKDILRFEYLRTPQGQAVAQQSHKKFISSGKGQVSQQKSETKRKGKTRILSKATKVKRKEWHSSDKGKESTKKHRSSQKFQDTLAARHQIRLETDPIYAIRRSVRRFTSRLNRSLQSGAKAVAGSAIDNLGLSLPQFKLYCESHPNWQPTWQWSRLGKDFHLDHIVALALFDPTDYTQYLFVNHYTNLQPLSAVTHVHKSKADRELVRQGKLDGTVPFKILPAYLLGRA